MSQLFVYTLVTLGGIGFVFGAMLAFAAKRFAVETNPRVVSVLEMLPGVNCGGCGYAGCAAYAESVVLKGSSAALCSPGGQDVSHKISEMLGLEKTSTVRKVVCLHCAGSLDKAKDKYVYDGIRDCHKAMMLGGGPKACDYGCIGYGSCCIVCQFDALHMGEHGLPVVDREKCTGCGACVRECPKRLFTLQPDSTIIYLACSSHDKGKAVRDACSVGCIGCGICVKVTEGDDIEMKDNLPAINYDSSINLILAHYKCPTKSFIDLAVKRPHMSIDSKCKGHGKCAEVCPVKNCISGEPGKQYKIDPLTCIGCGLCLGVCPEKAIRVIGAMGYRNMER